MVAPWVAEGMEVMQILDWASRRGSEKGSGTALENGGMEG
jgi:hypothetical protein